MRVRVIVGIAFALALAAPVLPLQSDPSGASERVLCSPSAFHLSTVANDRSQGWGPTTLFLGTVRFTNLGATCVLPAGRMSTRAETGSSRQFTLGIGAGSSRTTGRLVVPRGRSATMFVTVTAVPPTDWNSSNHCPGIPIWGLLVKGPTRIWARPVAFSKLRGYCGAFHVATHTGLLQLSW